MASIVESTFEETLSIAERAVAIPSVTGSELRVLEFFEKVFDSWGWRSERIPVADARYNLFVEFGTPKIIFTTHVDVVPAPEQLFRPRRENGALFGRGACDAKGIAATMIGVCRFLESRKRTDFGLLLVVGEEGDGIGATVASEALRGRGVCSVVNGEPTNGKLVTGHKGMLRFRIRTEGRAAHSAYPDAGTDANAKLIRVCNRLLEQDLGHDPLLGAATLNIGLISGGVADNVVSPSAECFCNIRLVGCTENMLDIVRRVAGDEATVEQLRGISCVRLKSLPGFETETVSYFTDVPAFIPLTEDCYLYGPGNINVAHSDREHMTLADMRDGLCGYLRMYELISGNPVT